MQRLVARRGTVAVLAVLVATLVAQLALGLMTAVRRSAEDDLITLVGCQALGYVAVGFALCRMYAPEGSMRLAFGVRRPTWIAAVSSLMVGGGLYLGLARLDVWLAARVPSSEAEQAALERIFRDETAGDRLRLFIALVLVLAVARELFFRGVLFSVLQPDAATRRRAALYSCGLSLLLAFGGDVRSLVVQGVAALAFTWVRYASKTAICAVLAHMAFAAVPHALHLAQRSDAQISWRAVVVGVAALGLGLLGSSVGRLPSDEPLPFARETA
jgi:membrane protease YdiL (CAAX protease family)